MVNKTRNLMKTKKHANKNYFTFPTIGNSTDPHVSAPQWTTPDPRSAVKMPQIAPIITALIRSKRKCWMIKIKLTIISVIQQKTQAISWVRFPGKRKTKNVAFNWWTDNNKRWPWNGKIKCLTSFNFPVH